MAKPWSLFIGVSPLVILICITSLMSRVMLSVHCCTHHSSLRLPIEASGGESRHVKFNNCWLVNVPLSGGRFVFPLCSVHSHCRRSGINASVVSSPWCHHILNCINQLAAKCVGCYENCPDVVFLARSPQILTESSYVGDARNSGSWWFFLWWGFWQLFGWYDLGSFSESFRTSKSQVQMESSRMPSRMVL